MNDNKQQYNIAFGGSGAGSLIFAIEVYQKILPELLKIQSEYEVIFDFHHIGDTKNAPYGLRESKEIKQLTESFIRYLGHNVKANIAVIACNTASTVLGEKEINSLHKEMPKLEVIPIIDDSAAAIYKESQELANKKLNIGILSTTATMKSRQYYNDLQKLHKNSNLSLNIYEYDPQIWVKQIENGEEINVSTELDKIKDLLQEMDIIGLFCTHFPFIKEKISSYIKETINRSPKIISQSCIFTDRILNKIQKDKVNFAEKRSVSGKSKIPNMHSNITGDNLDKIKNIAKNVADEDVFSKIIFSKINIDN